MIELCGVTCVVIVVSSFRLSSIRCVLIVVIIQIYVASESTTPAISTIAVDAAENIGRRLFFVVFTSLSAELAQREDALALPGHQHQVFSVVEIEKLWVLLVTKKKESYYTL